MEVYPDSESSFVDFEEVAKPGTDAVGSSQDLQFANTTVWSRFAPSPA